MSCHQFSDILEIVYGIEKLRLEMDETWLANCQIEQSITMSHHEMQNANIFITQSRVHGTRYGIAHRNGSTVKYL